MVTIDIPASLESFRKFVILSTCGSRIPRAYLANSNIFIEREHCHGLIYIETADKSTLKKIKDIEFVIAKDVFGIVYNSKSKDTSLKWKRKRGNSKVVGKASTNSLINLSESGVLHRNGLICILKNRPKRQNTRNYVLNSFFVG